MRDKKGVGVYDFDNSIPDCVPPYRAHTAINRRTHARYPCPLCATLTVFIPLKDYEGNDSADRNQCLYKFSTSGWLYHWDGIPFPNWKGNRERAARLRRHFTDHHKGEPLFLAFEGRQKGKRPHYREHTKLKMRRYRGERKDRVKIE
jgi:hypothetical protein